MAIDHDGFRVRGVGADETLGTVARTAIRGLGEVLATLGWPTSVRIPTADRSCWAT